MLPIISRYLKINKAFIETHYGDKNNVITLKENDEKRSHIFVVTSKVSD